MKKLTNRILDELFLKLKKIQILVVGDVMLDQYWLGHVSRISPEAPIPVVQVQKETSKLGGAANVAQNIKSLGAKPHVVGVAGKDNNGKILLECLKTAGIHTRGILADSTRPTTTKTRVIAQNHHLVRVDQESTAYFSQKTEQLVLQKIKNMLKQCNAVIIEDYNKGIFSTSLIKAIIKLARDQHKIITVDPKYENSIHYKGVTVLKPNLKEVEALTGKNITTKNIAAVCKNVLQLLQLQNIVLTLGKDGMVFMNKNDKTLKRIPTFAQKVYDVSGAGDTVISTLTLCLAAGLDISMATVVANHAAGAVCQEVGVVPVTASHIKKSFASRSTI